jgi:hypothetical protein
MIIDLKEFAAQIGLDLREIPTHQNLETELSFETHEVSEQNQSSTQTPPEKSDCR